MANDKVIPKKKTVKHKPPSRIRYEESHPTVSCRISREIYDRLIHIRIEGKSLADILKIGLGILEPKTQKIVKARNKGYVAGYNQGYHEAEQLYNVTYPCSVCGETMEITSEKEKKSAGKYMRENGWGHATCINRNQ